MASRSRAARNAIGAVLLVAFVGSVIGYGIIRLMHGMDPCHAVNTQLLPSPQGDYMARRVEVSCKPPKSNPNEPRHQVQVTVAERNPANGRVTQYGTVFICRNVVSSQVQIAWEAPYKLGIRFPQEQLQSSDITGRQPKFKSVEIDYGELGR